MRWGWFTYIYSFPEPRPLCSPAKAHFVNMLPLCSPMLSRRSLLLPSALSPLTLPSPYPLSSPQLSLHFYKPNHARLLNPFKPSSQRTRLYLPQSNTIPSSAPVLLLPPSPIPLRCQISYFLQEISLSREWLLTLEISKMWISYPGTGRSMP